VKEGGGFQFEEKKHLPNAPQGQEPVAVNSSLARGEGGNMVDKGERRATRGEMFVSKEEEPKEWQQETGNPGNPEQPRQLSLCLCGKPEGKGSFN